MKTKTGTRIALVMSLFAVTLLGSVACDVRQTPSGPTAIEPAIPTAAPQPENDSQAADVRVQLRPGSSALNAVFDDGRVATDWDSYDAAGRDLLRIQQEVSGTIEFVDSSPPDRNSAQAAWQGTVWFTNYFFRISAESGRIGGCINRSVPHAGFMLKDKRTDRQIVNLHIASWFENGRLCAAVYNSATGWCRKICSPSRAQLQGIIVDALIAVGISAAVAIVIAQVVMPFVLAIVVI